MVIRVRLPATALRHYLQPSAGQQVSGRVLSAPVRRETLVPAGVVLASSRDAGLVELPIQVDPGDMAQGLRAGDSVQVLAAYTEGARRGRAVVLLPSAEVVRVLQDPAGLAGTGQERGVQLRMPGDRAPIVVAAVATARIFVVKTAGLATEPAATDRSIAPPPPEPGTAGSEPDPAAGSGPPAASEPDPPGSGSEPPAASEPDPPATEPDPPAPDPGPPSSGPEPTYQSSREAVGT